ncbi:hypothetical protein HIM_10071 [Hirsutella minnesotensis 3608]|uniref:DUF7587 domain-containing protein n=1 Tax=Hirsutella minnesotensis 3608 TaxID=1043627 RepID=A0A0F7ZXD4_9HYPO|nr:hypothetical protein HIM_10071 [Hirsutella minnesotensis 3608]
MTEVTDDAQALLASAFAELGVDTPGGLQDATAGQELAEPAVLDAFRSPLLYRVAHEDCPSLYMGKLRARMFPPPSLAELSISSLVTHTTRHARLSNTLGTRWISTTTDLIRALHIAFFMYREKENITVYVINPRNLPSGNCLPCNEVRIKCGIGAKNIYKTETLVWGEIPESCIIHKWTRADIIQSGLLDVIPLQALGPESRLVSLRDVIRRDNVASYPTRKVAKVLRKVAKVLLCLKMDPSSWPIKQLFEFLLGQAAGYEVQKEFDSASARLQADHPRLLEEFDRCLYTAAIHLGKGKVSDYFNMEYALDVEKYCNTRNIASQPAPSAEKRKWRKDWSRIVLSKLQPTFHGWLATRLTGELAASPPPRSRQADRLRVERLARRKKEQML